MHISDHTHKLFVYGLLRRGLGNDMAGLLERGAEWLGEGFVYGKLYDIGQYPGLVLDEAGEETVKGDVYTIHDHAILDVLDDFEGIGPRYPYPHEYRRIKASVYMPGDSGSHPCWLYEYAWEIDSGREIDSGDYIGFISNPRF